MADKKTYFQLEHKSTFGKYKGQTWQEIVEKDPAWVSWAIKNVEWAEFDPAVYLAIGEPLDIPAVAPPPTSKAEANKMSLEILEEMIGTCSALIGGSVEHASLGTLVVMPIPNPSVLDRMYAHFTEMKKFLVSGNLYTIGALPVENTARPQPQEFPKPDHSVPAWVDPTDDLPF